MTKEQILTKLIEIAVGNGWKGVLEHWGAVKKVEYGEGNRMGWIWYEAGGGEQFNWYSILFDLDFARALWGEELVCYDCGEKVGSPDTVMGGMVQIGTGTCDCSRQFENNEPMFEYQLKQLVILSDKEKFIYLENYLKEKGGKYEKLSCKTRGPAYKGYIRIT